MLVQVHHLDPAARTFCVPLTNKLDSDDTVCTVNMVHMCCALDFQIKNISVRL